MATVDGNGMEQHKPHFEIRTKSIEQTLVPLVTQITTLVNHKEKPIASAKTCRAIVRVGQAASLAVERFVAVGEAIADEHPEIRQDMYEACKEAHMSGSAIAKLTDMRWDDQSSRAVGLAEKVVMIKAARSLLSAITHVLVLADKIVVKQLLQVQDKVAGSLDRLEQVTNFTEFVNVFSQFGQEMVELAHLTGDRQNDLKDEKRRAQMGVARSVLEKGTMMLLTSCKTLRSQLLAMLQAGAARENDLPSSDFESLALKVKKTSQEFRKQVQDTALEQANDVFGSSTDTEVVAAMKTAGVAVTLTGIDELTLQLLEHSEQLQERRPCGAEQRRGTNFKRAPRPQVISAAQTLSTHPSSKIGKENLDIFCDAWEMQVSDTSVLVKEVTDACFGRIAAEKQTYMSLPRPGKHGTTAKWLRPARLNAEEQAKIAKLGLEMKLITSEMDAETEKWEEAENDVVKRAKNMSSMAFSMYLFTRGEGPLKTTQDLFTQAAYFAEEANKLHKSVKEFLFQVPNGPQKSDLQMYLDKVPPLIQQLLFTIKSPTIGKAATFNKVDSVIQETKNLMNAIAKLVTTCLICATKYSIDYRGSPHMAHRWRQQPPMNGNGDDASTSSDTSGILRSASAQKSLSNLASYGNIGQ
ncbi:PREDICTED: alpha-catulin-like [Priapulus caudatus]|uniref:Alpha-catulin-like n=1 Tax=Priapulus caudatus TaxID=37621 RepID=A0ABM1ECI4_PRICU|nr:PREDICTED: alpha-catulin-like [Priapulus caudatus]